MGNVYSTADNRNFRFDIGVILGIKAINQAHNIIDIAFSNNQKVRAANKKWYLIGLSSTQKCLMTLFVLCCLFANHQASAATNTHDIDKTVTETTVQEGKVMTNKSLGMPAGKRVGPKDVNPVTANGVRYEVLHWGRERGLDQNGGYIVAKDAASNKELWLAKIYSIEYKPKLETDVQDIFIREIELSDDKKSLKIIDEDNRHFILDLSTQKVLMQ